MPMLSWKMMARIFECDVSQKNSVGLEEERLNLNHSLGLWHEFFLFFSSKCVKDIMTDSGEAMHIFSYTIKTGTLQNRLFFLVFNESIKMYW